MSEISASPEPAGEAEEAEKILRDTHAGVLVMCGLASTLVDWVGGTGSILLAVLDSALERLLLVGY